MAETISINIQTLNPVTDKPSEIAKERGIELKTEIQLENMINEFKKPFPFWAQWLMSHSVNKTENNRQAGYHLAIKAYFWLANIINWSIFKI
jgi:hypothetical protein